MEPYSGNSIVQESDSVYTQYNHNSWMCLIKRMNIYTKWLFRAGWHHCARVCLCVCDTICLQQFVLSVHHLPIAIIINILMLFTFHIHNSMIIIIKAFIAFYFLFKCFFYYCIYQCILTSIKRTVYAFSSSYMVLVRICMKRSKLCYYHIFACCPS